MIFVGIDPGKSGGIVILKEGRVFFRATDTKKNTEHDLASFLRGETRGDDARCVIERVSAGGGGHGKRKQGVTSMFTFGRSYGFLRGLLIGIGVPFIESTPSKWQQYFALKGPAGEPTTQKKNRHKAKAQQIYPREKITHAVADALLIATYCRSKHLELF